MRSALLAGAFALAAWAGNMLAIPPGFVTPLWLPSGVALAAVMGAAAATAFEPDHAAQPTAPEARRVRAYPRGADSRTVGV